ncbi:MAG: Septum site-determining protein MinD [Syntrophus sp. PtaB.Bin001]|nr:MAG: Septum site-determining protein MinD [Syntrophus sp. PtaB.Bin001]
MGSCSSCSSGNSPQGEGCAMAGNQPGNAAQCPAQEDKLKKALQRIKHKILVLSGKGGVGKSTVAVNLAVALALEGKHVGLLDVDFHGPSIPKLLHLEGRRPEVIENGLALPIEIEGGMKVMSLGFLLQRQDEAVIWRGPVKMGAIKQLLTDVQWGDLDYLVIDFPPGTGDEPLSVAQMIPDADGAVVVTTPQDVSTVDVSKSITFCRQLNIPILGVVENMSGLICPHCSQLINLFKQGGGEEMAQRMGVPFLGRIPLDPQIVESSDQGRPFVFHHQNSESAAAMRKIVQPLLELS